MFFHGAEICCSSCAKLSRSTREKLVRTTDPSCIWLLKYEKQVKDKDEVCVAFSFVKMISTVFVLIRMSPGAAENVKKTNKKKKQGFVWHPSPPADCQHNCDHHSAHFSLNHFHATHKDWENCCHKLCADVCCSLHVKVNTEETHPLFCLPCFPSHQTNTANWS